MHADEQIKFDLSFLFILCYFRPKLVSVTMTDISATLTSNILFFFSVPEKSMKIIRHHADDRSQFYLCVI